MIVYFAAVGNELWDSFVSGTEGHDSNVLYSFFDLELSGFKQRKKSWENITGEQYVPHRERVKVDTGKSS
jgi:hypothetical protein